MSGHPLCFVTVSTYFLIGWQKEIALPCAMSVRAHNTVQKWDHEKPERAFAGPCNLTDSRPEKPLPIFILEA